MRFSLDKTFALPAAALQLRAQRTQVLAQNLANADTPNYKARDLDFRQALAQAQGELPTLRTTHVRHISPDAGVGGAATAALRYRVPMSASLDGNTVETHAEQARFAENTVHYQATLSFFGQRIQSLISAIRGE